MRMGRVSVMVSGNYRDFFVVIATSAATLIGLLFVAMSVSGGRARAHPQVIREFRAAAALFSFINAFTVSLFGLVPNGNIGYPAAIISVIGILFTASGVRTTLALPTEIQRRRPQVFLILGLLSVLGFQLFYGIELIQDEHRHTALDVLGYVLITSLLIGIGRSWELVGDRDISLFASIGFLVGHDPTGSVAAAARAKDVDGADTGNTPVAPVAPSAPVAPTAIKDP